MAGDRRRRHDALDVAALKQGLPAAGRQVHGHRIVYLDSAASSQRPGRCSTPCASTTRRPTPTCTAASTRSPRRPTRRFEAARVDASAASSARRDPSARSSSPKTPPRRSTWSPHTWGRAHLQPGRRRRAHRDGAPRQHRPLADAGRASAASTCGGSPIDDDGRLDLDDLDRLLDGVKLVGVHVHVERARDAHTRRRDRRGRPRRRRAGAWPTAPSRFPTCRPTCPRSASTSWPSAPTRCSGPPGSASSGAARSCSRPCRRSSAAAR